MCRNLLIVLWELVQGNYLHVCSRQKNEYGCSSTVVDTGVRLPKTSKRTPHRSGPTFLRVEMPTNKMQLTRD